MAEKTTDKPRAVRSHDVALDKEYIQWIQDIKQRFRNSQIKAAVKVNSEQLLFNWQFGRDLVVRKAEEKLKAVPASAGAAFLSSNENVFPRMKMYLRFSDSYVTI